MATPHDLPGQDLSGLAKLLVDGGVPVAQAQQEADSAIQFFTALLKARSQRIERDEKAKNADTEVA